MPTPTEDESTHLRFIVTSNTPMLPHHPARIERIICSKESIKKSLKFLRKLRTKRERDWIKHLKFSTKNKFCFKPRNLSKRNNNRSNRKKNKKTNRR